MKQAGTVDQNVFSGVL